MIGKYLILIVSFVGLLQFTLWGDEFEDYIQTCSVISKNFKDAVQAPESRFGKEYRQHLNSFMSQSLKIQRVVRKLDLGLDFDFPKIADEIENIYEICIKEYVKEVSRKKRNKSSNKYKNHSKNKDKSKHNTKKETEKINTLQKISSTQDGILKVLLFDVKALRKMGFTTDDGGAIKVQYERKRKLLALERLVHFHQQGTSRFLYNKADVSFQYVFERRCHLLVSLARQLTDLHQKQYPDAQSRINLADEAGKLMQYSTKLKTASLKSNTIKGETSVSLRKDIRITERNICDIIRTWDHANFLTDPPLSAGNAADADDDEPDVETIMKKSPLGQKDYSKWNEKRLSDELAKRRREIIKGNSSLDGFDSESERLFLETLSREQKKKYQEYRKDYNNQGYDTSRTVRNSVMRLQMDLLSGKMKISAKEMIRILENIDKNKLKRDKDLKIRF